MKKIIIIILVVFYTIATNGQSIDTLPCGTPDRDTTEFENLPWFGNNAYLENFLDSIGYPSGMNKNISGELNPSGTVGINGIVGSERIKFHVPIKFWVYRNSAGVGGPTLQQLQKYIDDLNKYYNVDNNTLIGFYMRCEINYIDDNSHTNIESGLEASLLLQSHKERGCINIHIVNSLYDDILGELIRARFFGIDGIFLDQFTYSRPDLASTIAHEVGHYFELDHTHQYYNKGKCRKEPISRTRTFPFFQFCPFARTPQSNIICESTGDALNDTQADPDLISNFSCDYLLGGNDLWGDSYTNPPHGTSERPNTHNIMSYNGQRTCIDVFSRLQIAVMLYSIYRGKSSNNRAAWSDLRAEFDDYEMDNFSEAARPILLNEIQERNFNQQYYGDGVWGQCDVDWASFTPSCNQIFDIQTSEINGRTNANTRLTIFNATLNQLAQNDDISGSNHFSKITLSLVAGQTYFIRVENMSSSVTGYYNINVLPALAISGDNYFCNTLSNSYTISNFPTGAGIIWSTTPSVIAIPNSPYSEQTTLAKSGNGVITLTATITNACGATTLNKSISVGVPPVTITGPSSICPCTCCNYYTATSIPGATYTWSISPDAGNSVTTDMGNQAEVIITGPCYLTVQATTPCGTSSATFHIFMKSAGQCSGGCSAPSFVISPNPAQNTVTISRINSESIMAQTYKTSEKQLSSSISGINLVRIYDALGNLVKQQKIGNNNTTQVQMDVSSLISGTYSVVISAGTLSETQKMIIQR